MMKLERKKKLKGEFKIHNWVIEDYLDEEEYEDDEETDEDLVDFIVRKIMSLGKDGGPREAAS